MPGTALEEIRRQWSALADEKHAAVSARRSLSEAQPPPVFWTGSQRPTTGSPAAGAARKSAPMHVKSRILLLCVVSTVLCWGCAVSPPEPDPGIDTKRWQSAVFERTVGDCDARRPDCVSLHLRYPVRAPGPVLPVDRAVDAFVNEHLLAPVAAKVRPPDMETLAAQFVYEYEQVKETLTDYRSRWRLDREVFVIHASARVVSLCFSETLYTGGAHPNSRRRYQSLDAATGRPLSLEDLMAPGAGPRLQAVAAGFFRKVRGIAPGVSLAEAGFWFDDGRFALNDNYAVTGDGLLFYYNPYEIAPYAAGPTELLIPFAALNGLVDQRWPTDRTAADELKGAP